MTHYTMAAYPTTYRGVTYRSRLEARWAAFFDQLGWPYEYEPVDLGIWTPDFLLKPPTLVSSSEILAEVKPITSFDEETAQKMVTATTDQKVVLLLLGIAPTPPLLDGPDSLSRPLIIGWGYKQDKSAQCQWKEICIGWSAELHEPGFNVSLKYKSDDADESFSWLTDCGFHGYPRYFMEKWGIACAAVQWHPPENAL